MLSPRGIRIFLLGLILSWPPAALSAAVIEPGQASAFIEKLGNEAIGTLAQTGVDRKTREERLQYLLDKGFAIDAIAKFVLGRHWRRATESQRQRYLEVFEQLIVLSQVEGRFGAEVKPVIVLFLIISKKYQQFLGELLVADQIVVYKEDVTYAQFSQRIQLFTDLFNSLSTWLPAEHDDDVTEFTAIRTASGEL